MRTVFQVVATMVVANAAVAYGAGAKDAAAKIKGAAATKAADVKAKATEAAAEVKAEATAAATDAKATATEGVKKAEASAETSDSSSTPTAEEAKAAVQGAMEGQPANTEGLAGARKSLIIPESAVLPESVLRFRGIYAATESTKNYDAQGNKVDVGVKVTTGRSAAVFEYGITERISAQIVVPYVLNGKAEVDSKEDYIKTYVSGALKELKKGIEANATLAAVYNSGIPIGVELDLGTLDARLAGVKIPPTTPLKTFIDQQFVPLLTAGLNASTESYDAAVKTAEDTKFQKGLGDVEIGAKYALSTVNDPWFDGVPFYTSVAGGVRLNSSKYEEAKKKGEKEVGRGTMDGAIRLNADYEPLNGVQLQLENQTEFMLAKGKTWTATEAKAGKKVDFERDGMRQLGYSKLVIAPGTWIDGADFLMLNARYSWNNDAATKTDGKKDTGSAIYGRTAIAGVSFDGLKLKLPVQLDYDRVLSARSRNVEYASDAHVVTLKLFYKF